MAWTRCIESTPAAPEPVAAPPRILRIEGVSALVGVGRATIYLWVSQHKFPAPIKLNGSRLSAWRLDEVAAWIERQEAHRTAPGPITAPRRVGRPSKAIA